MSTTTTTQPSGDPTPAAPTPTTPATPPVPSDPKAGDQPKDDEPLGEPGKRALVAEREAREKAERDLAALRKEVEDSKKTAEEKAAEELDTARREAAENAAKALRYEIAAAKGLDLALAPRLTGTTREELEADADVLMGLIPKPDTTPTPSKTGEPVPTVSRTPQAPSGNVSLDQQIAAAEAAGEKALVAQLKALKLGQTN